MKTKILFSLLIFVMFFSGCQSQEVKTPDLLMSNEGGDQGGYPSPNNNSNGYPITLDNELGVITPETANNEFTDMAVPTPQPGLATVTGYVFSNQLGDYLVDVPVMLAKVYRNAENEGAFALDTASSPFALTDKNGRFVFTDIEAHEYVVVVGNVEVNRYEILTNPSGEPIIWNISPGEIFDANQVEVNFEW